MKQFGFVCLALILCACSTPVEMSRLVPSNNPSVPNLSSYSNLVVALPKMEGDSQNITSAREIQDIIVRELKKSEFFFINSDLDFQDGAEKLPLILNSDAMLQDTEQPIQTSSYYNAAAKQNVYVRTRQGSAVTRLTFRVGEFRNSGSSLFNSQPISKSVGDSTRGYNSDPDPIDYKQLNEKCISECVKYLVEDSFPHYQTMRYRVYTSSDLKDSLQRAIGCLQAKDFGGAENACQQAIQTGTNNEDVSPKELSQAYFLLGLCLEKQTKFDEAVKMYDEAIKRKNQSDFFHARQCAVKAKEDYAKLTGGSPASQAKAQ